MFSLVTFFPISHFRHVATEIARKIPEKDRKSADASASTNRVLDSRSDAPTIYASLTSANMTFATPR